jgi:autotransporter-associated beta strand protein
VFLFAASVLANPVVTITSTPAWSPIGTSPWTGYLSGTLTGVADPTQYVIAPLDYIPGSGWWPKPTFAQPWVNVNPDGTWTAPVFTGGIDPVTNAFIADAYLLSSTGSILATRTACPPTNALASAYVPRYGTTLSWCGYNWDVETTCVGYTGNAFGGQVGPNNNRFTDDPKYVWVSGGTLNINMQQNSGTAAISSFSGSGDGNYYAGQVTSEKSDFGYGKYRITLDTPLKTAFGAANLPANVVVGSLFTWQNSGNLNASGSNINSEFDLGEAGAVTISGSGMQNVAQPWQTPGNRYQLNLANLPNNTPLVLSMDWEPSGISCLATAGTWSDSWIYRGSAIPAPGVQMGINGWYYAQPSSGQAPTLLQFTSFSYSPTPVWNVSTGGSWNTPGNWNPNSVPNGSGQQAILGPVPTTPITVTLDSTQTLGTLTFENTGSYTLARGKSGSLTLDNGQIIVLSGNHSITAPLIIADSGAMVTLSEGSSLAIFGNISEAGSSQSLTLTGDGLLFLTGLNSYTGGTNVTGGTLIVGLNALPNGTSLTVGSAFVFGTEAAQESNTSVVPEPGTLALLMATAVIVLLYRKQR